MLELGISKKHKIVLSDYDFNRDIENRLLMANFTQLELQVLEEFYAVLLKCRFRNWQRL